MTKLEFQTKVHDYIQHFEPIEPYLTQTFFDEIEDCYLALFESLDDRGKLEKIYNERINCVDDEDLTIEFLATVKTEKDLFFDFECFMFLNIDATVVKQVKPINGKVYDPYKTNSILAESSRGMADAVLGMISR